MLNVRISYPILCKVVEELNGKVISNHFANISAINSSDILISFSFYNKERFLISLNHTSPFCSFIDFSFALPSVKSPLNENLRKTLKGVIIKSIEVKKNDRVIFFRLERTNEFFEKVKLTLVLELIPTKTNLLILDKDNKVIYAYKYLDLTHSRPIVRGLEYIPLPDRDEVVIKDALPYEDFKNNVKHYLIEASEKRQREMHQDLFNHLVSKRKSLLKKIDVLSKEIETAKEKLIYQEYGEYLYTYMYTESLLNEYIETLGDLYNKDLSPKENANKLFNIYKKSKRTIEMDELEKNKAYQEIETLNQYINTFTYLDEDELNDLYQKYFAYKMNKIKKSKVDARMPFYVNLGSTIIAFGKNSTQNEYLTFKKAHKDYTFVHIDKLSGSHIVIFSSKPTNEELLLASEIALILSNEVTGDIKYCPLINVKKGTSTGEVLIDHYKLITLREIREETYALLKEQKRFIF